MWINLNFYKQLCIDKYWYRSWEKYKSIFTYFLLNTDWNLNLKFSVSVHKIIDLNENPSYCSKIPLFPANDPADPTVFPEKQAGSGRDGCWYISNSIKDTCKNVYFNCTEIF